MTMVEKLDDSPIPKISPDSAIRLDEAMLNLQEEEKVPGSDNSPANRSSKRVISSSRIAKRKLNKQFTEDYSEYIQEDVLKNNDKLEDAIGSSLQSMPKQTSQTLLNQS